MQMFDPRLAGISSPHAAQIFVASGASVFMAYMMGY